MRRTRIVSSLAATLLLGACSGGALGNLGALGEILGQATGAGAGQQPQQGQIQAEVQSVDTNNQRINLRTQQGQSGAVLFDNNTAVVYQQQRYPVTALERGDLVAVQVQQLNNNQLYAARVDVVQSVQERTGMR